MKVIFLDVDGVLHGVQDTGFSYQFRPQCMALLKRIVDEASQSIPQTQPVQRNNINTPAPNQTSSSSFSDPEPQCPRYHQVEIVLSSTWRVMSHTKRVVDLKLKEHGIERGIHSCTPWIPGAPARGQEIASWLQGDWRDVREDDDIELEGLGFRARDKAQQQVHVLASKGTSSGAGGEVDAIVAAQRARRVSHYVALDDLDLLADEESRIYMEGHVVKTRPDRGLCETDAERAIKILFQ